tara:strand:- start:829 stop:1386 length:558 start_codon:yes stop_codon:yes gene_type:complete
MPRAATPETFFIRGSVTPDDDATYVESTIDLGSFVNVGAKKAVIMRVHNVEGEWAAGPSATGSTVPGGAPLMDANTGEQAVWQLSTQTQVGIIDLNDRSCVAKGMIWARNPDAAANPPSQVYSDSHLPQQYAEGYLIATDNIYLGAYAGTGWAEQSDLTFNVQLEVSLETVDTDNAVSLALSQQM